jgi:hypothetical protein
MTNTLWKSCLLNACRSTSFRNLAEWHRAYQPAADAKSGTKIFLRKTSAAFANLAEWRRAYQPAADAKSGTMKIKNELHEQ